MAKKATSNEINDSIKTAQHGIKQHRADMSKYSLFMGGLNTKHNSLEQYSPLKTGYSRIFITKLPVFMDLIAPGLTKRFKHMMEYGFIGVDGIQGSTMDFEQLTGGYSGKSFDTAVNNKDETNEITVKLYEFSGSPLREYIDLWSTGILDPHTGLGHYHGAIEDGKTRYSQHNHTMEMFYVNTDETGRSDSIEYACLLTNMMPKEVKKDHFNYEAGQHNLTQIDITFTAVKYESAQINEVAIALISKYKIIRDYLSFESDYKVENNAVNHNGVNVTPNVMINDWGSEANTTS